MRLVQLAEILVELLEKHGPNGEVAFITKEGDHISHHLCVLTAEAKFNDGRVGPCMVFHGADEGSYPIPTLKE